MRHYLGTFTSLWYRQRPFAHIEEDARRVALKRPPRVLKSVFLPDKGSWRILVGIAKESQPHALEQGMPSLSVSRAPVPTLLGGCQSSTSANLETYKLLR